METNLEAVKVALRSERDIWKSEKVVNFVEDYIENCSQALDLCVSLEKCLKRIRDTRLLILVVLQHLEDMRYEKTLENLNIFLLAGDPFTQDLEELAMKENLDSFSKDVEKLAMKANCCSNHIQRAKNGILYAIQWQLNM